ncbi:polymer-forming cytoskeletal protein, partial [Microcoleus sp. Pol11C3]|uniref:polymer-forming cytoskeletal protein n=1 Tax=Microcoleus sp. Pol11C3 TaxID=3055390 RepID=UPI002FD24880
GTTTTKTLTVSEDANVTGTTTTKTLTVLEDANVTGTTNTKTLTVLEDANVTGEVTVSKNANVTGTTTTKTLTVLEDANVTGTTATTTLTVAEDANVTGKLTVFGDANVTGTTATTTLIVSKDANVTGELKVTGQVTADTFIGKLGQASSRVIKEEINDLSSQEVSAILRTLNPVKFIYTEDESKTPHAGFIAEDTPDLLTAHDKQAIKVVDIVAILTKVAQDHRKTLSDVVKIVKKQQAEIAALTQKIKKMEEKTDP